MMDTRSTFLLQVLEKLATPMVAAISEVSVRQMMVPDPKVSGSMRPDAEQVAGLLTKSTQMSIGLSQLVDMKLPDGEADSLRLALTSLASPLMANIFRLAGRAPSDVEIERVNAAMSAVMSYSDSFAPAGDANIRMSQIDVDFFPMDPTQVTLLYMNALLPAVNSIMAYSFGQAEKKLVQDVSDRLVRESKVLRGRLFPALPEGPEAAKADLALLRMTAQIYSQCHFAEMAKLMATEDQVRQGMAPAMTTLWQSFILRMQMLEILGDALIPDKNKKTGTSAGSAGKAPQAQDKPTESPPMAAPASPPSSPPSSPMGFFVKKNSA